MRVKTAELTDAALDWAVARALGKRPSLFIYQQTGRLAPEHNYSTNWSQGGPIIEREKIDTFNQDNGFAGAIKMATDQHLHPKPYFGPTSLTAAMRCYVASKLGEEVEVPDEL